MSDPKAKQSDGPTAGDQIPWTPVTGPTARQETIERLRREITSGTYRIPSDAVADAIIRFFAR